MGTFRKVEFAYLSINGSDNIADQLEDVPSIVFNPQVVTLPDVSKTLQPSGSTTETGAFACMLRSGTSTAGVDIDTLLGGTPGDATKPSLKGSTVAVKAQEKVPASPGTLGTGASDAPLEDMMVHIGSLPVYPPGAVGTKAVWSVQGVINAYEQKVT